MNEAETRAELIDPALRAAGWGVVDGSRVRREVITLGRLQGAGQRAKQDIADYVLFYRGQKLGVIEANLPPSRPHPCSYLAPSLRKCFSKYGPKVSALLWKEFSSALEMMDAVCWI